MDTEIHPITPAASGFDRLVEESLAEGHGMLLRLKENWATGANRFSAPGEMIVAAFQNGKVVGVCGRNADPYVKIYGNGRVRHLFVAKASRGTGIGSLLLRSIVSGAEEFFDALNTRAPQEAFRFYESHGFRRVQDDAFVTHRLELDAGRR